MTAIRIHRSHLGLILALATLMPLQGADEDHQSPTKGKPTIIPTATEGAYRIEPDKPRQVIAGLGFEIQCDSINSGNKGVSEARTSVPHDLVPAERRRLADEMLKGFRYCRLAGGLYWRGLDAGQRQFQPRWPEQLDELRELLDAAKVEGLSFEYWSPAPYWKANRALTGKVKQSTDNLLRCFNPDFAQDPEYHGDTGRFLKDFAEACRNDLETLRRHGLRTVLWGLQNEPKDSGGSAPYGSCGYPKAQQAYPTTFLAVEPVIRAFDPSIRIIADSWRLDFIDRVARDPVQGKLVDWLVVHHIGADAKEVAPMVKGLRARGFTQPIYQNEYEYLQGRATPARCLNTTMNIMAWFQQAQAPSWFWIHALKPTGNSEGSGYALGFWRPANQEGRPDAPDYPGLKPGHWTWNTYNWHAVGSFVKHLPWDSRAVTVSVPQDSDLALMSYLRPDGKLTVVVANRSSADHTFSIETGVMNATFKGFRYTPEEAGPGTMGAEIGTLTGGTIAPKVGDMTWEFWEQQ